MTSHRVTSFEDLRDRIDALEGEAATLSDLCVAVNALHDAMNDARSDDEPASREFIAARGIVSDMSARLADLTSEIARLGMGVAHLPGAVAVAGAMRGGDFEAAVGKFQTEVGGAA